MKKGLKLFIAIFGILGIFAMAVTPIYLLIESYLLRETLPQGYIIINLILSGLIIISVFVIITLWISDEKK